MEWICSHKEILSVIMVLITLAAIFFGGKLLIFLISKTLDFSKRFKKKKEYSEESKSFSFIKDKMSLLVFAGYILMTLFLNYLSIIKMIVDFDFVNLFLVIIMDWMMVFFTMSVTNTSLPFTLPRIKPNKVWPFIGGTFLIIIILGAVYMIFSTLYMWWVENICRIV